MQCKAFADKARDPAAICQLNLAQPQRRRDQCKKAANLGYGHVLNFNRYCSAA